MLEAIKIFFLLIKTMISTFFQMLLIFWNPILLIPIFIIIAIYFIKAIQYRIEAYYKITHVPFLKTIYDAGRHGEYLTYKYLKHFEKKGARFLFNIYVPKKEDTTTEIDVLMISRKGLFVFESKNYGGWIFGNDSQRYWYQTLPAGRGRSHKESFYNPIFQNNTHIKYIKSLIGEQVPMYSIITFSNRCTLKNVNVYKPNTYVINRYEVKNLISSFYEYDKDILSDVEVNDIYNKLYPYTQVSEKEKQKHIYNINRRLYKHGKIELPIIDIDEKIKEENNQEPLKSETIENPANEEIIKETNNIEQNIKNETNNDAELICPNCGGKLVLRIAKYGEHAGETFYGCSNYPNCKYTRK